MTRTNAEKLQIKPDTEVLIDPVTEERRDLIGSLPPGATVVTGADHDTDGVVVLFVTSSDELNTLIDARLPLLGSPRATWVAYPKGNRVDINRDVIWKRVADDGWTLTANIALSDVWSAVRVKRINAGDTA